MEEWLSKESFLAHLTLWKWCFGFIFLAILLFFGDLFRFAYDMQKKVENKWGRYLYSTLTLLLLFFALRVMNIAYDLWRAIMNRSS